MNVDVTTVNSEDPYQDLVRFVEEAAELFWPKVWDTINYTGEVKFPPDRILFFDGEPVPSLEINKLIMRLRRIKGKNPLIAIISTHLVYFPRTRYERSRGKIATTFMPIRDYMDEVGFVCLLRLEEQLKSGVIAHTLGHNRGLRHHVEPIDLMYAELNPETQYSKPFCNKCVYILERSEGVFKMVQYKFERYLKRLKSL